MVPQILEKMQFRSLNDHHRQGIEALEALTHYADSKFTFYRKAGRLDRGDHV